MPTVSEAAVTSLPALAAPAETLSNLASQVASRSAGKTSRFDVQLTPEGLGRVDVAVEIDSTGKVSATLSFEKPEGASLAKSRSAELQLSLASLGLSLTADGLRIEHSGQVAQFAAADTVASTLAGAAQPHGDIASPSPNGQAPAQHAATGGQQFDQGRGQQHRGEQPAGPAFGGLRSFEFAAGAADAVDQRQAYAARLATRGLDIRI